MHSPSQISPRNLHRLLFFFVPRRLRRFVVFASPEGLRVDQCGSQELFSYLLFHFRGTEIAIVRSPCRFSLVGNHRRRRYGSISESRSIFVREIARVVIVAIHVEERPRCSTDTQRERGSASVLARLFGKAECVELRVRRNCACGG